MFKTINTHRFYCRWKEYGNGPKLLLAFQGFNRSPEDFENFEPLLGNHYTILSFELFFHGESRVKPAEKPLFTLLEFKELIQEIISAYKCEKFEVIAYSFGGRMAMNCVEVLGSQITGMYLMAPDALRFNAAFRFSTQTRVGAYLFTKFNSNPGYVISIMEMAKKFGIRDKKAIDFYIGQIRDEEIRNRVYYLWNAHSNTIPVLQNVVRNINNYNIRTLLFFGKNDTVINAKPGKKLISKINKNAELVLLDTGHRLPEKFREISEIILKS